MNYTSDTFQKLCCFPSMSFASNFIAPQKSTAGSVKIQGLFCTEAALVPAKFLQCKTFFGYQHFLYF